MDDFERAAALVTSGELPALADADKLRLYGLFCVAKKGADPGRAPSALSFRAAAKHAAWTDAADIHTPASARAAYIALVAELALSAPAKDDGGGGGGWGKEAPSGFEIGTVGVGDEDADTQDVCYWAAVGDARKVARELRDNRLLRDHRDADGLTPLMRAADRGHIAVLDALLGAGADVALTDADGFTALHYAALCGHAAAAGALVRAGAPLDVRDTDGATPLESAADDDTRAAIEEAQRIKSACPPTGVAFLSPRAVAVLAGLFALAVAVAIAFWYSGTN